MLGGGGDGCEKWVVKTINTFRRGHPTKQPSGPVVRSEP